MAYITNQLSPKIEGSNWKIPLFLTFRRGQIPPWISRALIYPNFRSRIPKFSSSLSHFPTRLPWNNLTFYYYDYIPHIILNRFNFYFTPEQKFSAIFQKREFGIFWPIRYPCVCNLGALSTSKKYKFFRKWLNGIYNKSIFTKDRMISMKNTLIFYI